MSDFANLSAVQARAAAAVGCQSTTLPSGGNPIISAKRAKPMAANNPITATTINRWKFLRFMSVEKLQTVFTT